MKRTHIILLAALVASACSKDGDTLQSVTCEDAVRFSGTPVLQTKTAYEEAEDALKVTWNIRDEIGFYALCGGETVGGNILYRTAGAGPVSDFTPGMPSLAIGWKDETSSHDFYAYYPYDASAGKDAAAVKISLPAVQNWSFDDPLGHLAPLDFMYASAEGLKKSESTVDLKFRHLYSIVEVRMTSDLRVPVTSVIFRCKSNPEAALAFEGGKFDLTNGRLDLSEATTTNEVRLDCALTTSDEGDESVVRLLVVPGHGGETFEAVAVAGGKEYTIATVKAPADGIPTGRAAVVRGKVDFDESVAIPIVNLSAAGTANTYYVTEANTLYRFRADVRGNGKALTCGGLSYTEEDLKIEPKAALVLWYCPIQTTYLPWSQVSPILLESVKLKKNGYIYFDTPETFIKGNVVIIALDRELDYDEIEADADLRISNAEVLWSWNLVCAEGYDPDAAENCFTKGGYTFMGRNLGAVIGGPEDLTSASKPNDQSESTELAWTTGNSYQWGRKDPFPGIPDYMSNNFTYMTSLWFAPNYTPIPALDRGTFEAWGRQAHHQMLGNKKELVVIDMVKVLGAGYTTQQAFDLGRTCPNLWLWRNQNYLTDNAGLAAWGNPSKDATGVKTIYDPCPYGWKVMSKKAWMALSDNENPTNAKFDLSRSGRGFWLDDKWFFPLAGCAQHWRDSKGENAGSPYNGGCSTFWVDGPDDTEGGHVGSFVTQNGFSSDATKRDITCKSQNTYSDRGAAVRCIRIDE